MFTNKSSLQSVLTRMKSTSRSILARINATSCAHQGKGTFIVYFYKAKNNLEFHACQGETTSHYVIAMQRLYSCPMPAGIK